MDNRAIDSLVVAIERGTTAASVNAILRDRKPSLHRRFKTRVKVDSIALSYMGCSCSTPLPNSAKVDLSHFTILRTIGKGGFGTVTAVQKLSEPLKDETFAMKTMGKVQLLQSRQGLRIAWRERNVLRIVKSPFVPKLHYAFQDEGSLYLVLDFLVSCS